MVDRSGCRTGAVGEAPAFEGRPGGGGGDDMGGEGDIEDRVMDLESALDELKAEFDAKVAPLNEKMDKLEAKLLDVFNQTGMDSVKTESGTAYTTTRVTASVADKDVFMTRLLTSISQSFDQNKESNNG